MRPSRRVLLLALTTLLFGSLALTGGYAWYLRSAAYREHCASVLSTSLGLPAAIGRVEPLSWSTRGFRDIRIWLPERRDLAAALDWAEVASTATPADPAAWELRLDGGQCEISTRTWLRNDYRYVLESGLRPGFDPLGPRRVVFRDLKLHFQRGEFEALLSEAAGVVTFVDAQRGRAEVTCGALNGYHADLPAALQAEFTPQVTGIQLDRVLLTVPRLPLRVLELEDLAGFGLQSGWFDGRLLYAESAGSRRLTLGGRIYELPLSELTGGLFERPWHGVVPVLELGEFGLHDGRPTNLRFSGVITDVVPGDILATFGLPDCGGKLTLRVRVAELSANGIDSLIASGRCEDVGLADAFTGLGWGRMSGRASLVIDDLTICENRLVSLDAVLSVARHDDNWVERQLLSEVLRRTLGFTLPAWLPERFPYAELGVRIEVRDEVLYVFGTHGPGEKTILTISFGGRDLPLVREPEEPFAVQTMLDPWRQRMTREFGQRFEPVSSAPASAAADTAPSRPTEE